MERKGLFILLSELALVRPKLVLMRGRDYDRIEDLIRWARRDMSKSPDIKELLSNPIYWHTDDERGKIIIKGINAKGDEFVAYVEPGSDARTSDS